MGNVQRNCCQLSTINQQGHLRSGQYQRERGRMQQNRGYYSNSRGSYRGGYNSYKTEVRSEGSTRERSSFCVKVSASEINKNDVSINSEIVWLLDNGSTNHTVNKEIYFHEYITLKKPVNVKVGDERTHEATKDGRIEAVRKLSLIMRS